MKRKKDAGLLYMQELGIVPAKNASQAREAVEKLPDHEALFRVLADDAAGPQAFYKVKNRDLETSMAVNGAFSGDVYRKACNVIDGAPELFGTEILDLGCEAGIMTCFLARRFPESRVTGTDLCPEAVAAARELKEKLGAENAAFAEAAGTRPAGSFDTVFSLRTMHENCDVPEDDAAGPAVYEDACAAALRDYAEGLASCLRPGGKILFIEREGSIFHEAAPEDDVPVPEGADGRDALFRGFLRALSAAGLRPLQGSYRRVTASEAGQESGFHAFAAAEG